MYIAGVKFTRCVRCCFTSSSNVQTNLINSPFYFIYNVDHLKLIIIIIYVSGSTNHKTAKENFTQQGARCSSVVRAFAHGAMGRRIDPAWGGPIELFLVPASAPRLV